MRKKRNDAGGKAGGKAGGEAGGETGGDAGRDASGDAGGGEGEAKSGAIYRNMMMLSSRKIMKNAVQPPSSDDNSFWRYVPYTSL